ncbi:hypothetical protein D6T64_08930 [Cryobacterium melibiosiphilum]|uniref:Uncharacterized protein n=1 Tax=Cryobacterium melibiosiphilum TaxID=995039 RepID=A0A3A5MUL8_9MICO|nr:hypothetical protein [Cryobacterium melibiosiphilum]RJT88894.1 hypothetical protein D6T64_08930 [Cryobacterium melibiosiphilum]
MIVALVSAAIMLLGTWSVDDRLRWVFLALIPVSGIVGVVLSVRNLSRGTADQRLDRVTLIVNAFVVIAVIPLLWAVVVIVSGP